MVFSRKPKTENRQSASNAGFTLLELLAVLGLMSLLLGLVMPGMYRSWMREKERASLRQLAVSLKAARSAAATQHRRVRVFVDVKSGRYRVEGLVGAGELAPGVVIKDAHLVWQDMEKRQGYIAFYGDGTSSGGKLALTGRTGPQLLEVEIITGKVSLKAEGKT
jgi:general secretion pathway protein H